MPFDYTLEADGRTPRPLTEEEARRGVIEILNDLRERGLQSVGNEVVGNLEVSTVFIGRNHSYDPDETAPVLWESVIFAPDDAYVACRYSSWDDADVGHRALVSMLKVAERWSQGLLEAPARPEGQPLVRITLDEDDPQTRVMLAAGSIAIPPRPPRDHCRIFGREAFRRLPPDNAPEERARS